MSFYQKAQTLGEKFFRKDQLFKFGFNFSPMYRRSQGRILSVSKDIREVKIKLKINWKNRNYMNTIFGGSMFSALDPIPMIQLVYILGKDYVIWDKSAEIRFKKPANVNLYATFHFSQDELESIKNRVAEENEIVIPKNTLLTDQKGERVFCEVKKYIYIADKAYYKKRKKTK